MEDSILEYLGYIIAFLFVIIPRFIKWLAKRGGEARNEPGQGKRAETEQMPIDVLEEAIGELAGVEPEVERISIGEFERILQRAHALHERARELKRLSGIRPGPALAVMGRVESACVNPAKSIRDHLEARKRAGDIPEWEEGRRIVSNLDRLDMLADVFESMIGKRVLPGDADLLRRLDTMAKECLAPYLAHARSMNLQYPTKLAAVVFGIPGEDLANLMSSAGIAPVIVDENAKDEPRAWINIASDVFLDVFHGTRGLARRTAAELRAMPRPMSLDDYADKRSFTAGLIGGWLPRIFADSCAALLLGPGFASGLAMLNGTESDSADPLDIVVGARLRSSMPPLYVRMFVACRVLQHLGMDEEARGRFGQWSGKIERGPVFTIREIDGRKAAMPVAHLLDAVSATVDYLMRRPLEPLGGISLPAIPSLSISASQIEEMKELSGRFLKGEPADAPARIILGAAQLAAEKSNALSRVVAKAALGSLDKESRPAETPMPEDREAVTLEAHARSPELVLRAIAVAAAMAPRTARYSRARYPT